MMTANHMKTSITEGYVPGAIGGITQLHGEYYSRHWGFGIFFETKVACELATFLGRFEPGRDGFWCATHQGRAQGGIAIDGSKAREEGAHLRWFIVAERLKGQGLGSRLMHRALQFCRDAGHPKVYLWTFEGLHAARHLYEKAGFHLVKQQQGTQWGAAVEEQYFELTFG